MEDQSRLMHYPHQGYAGLGLGGKYSFFTLKILKFKIFICFTFEEG